MGSRKSSSASATTTQQQDNRVVGGGDAVGAGGYLSRFSYDDSDINVDSSSRYAFTDTSNRSSTDNSIYAVDSSDRSMYAYDSSDRSATTSYNYGTDAARIVELNAQLAGAVGEQQSDAVRAVAALGGDNIRQLGESVTNLYGQAGANVTRAWETTLDRSQALIESALASAGNTTDAARTIAQTAIASYQPAEAKQADALKYLAIAGAIGLGFIVLKKG